MRIALSMIVRDEAADIVACLESARPHVDVMHVVDTGSTDGTPELAASAGATVRHFPWCDDFAAARNAALEGIEADWVLVLDADERLEGTRVRAQLEAFAAAHPRAAGKLTILDDGDQGEGRSQIVRFFPRAGARWERRVHEQIRLDGATPPSGDTGIVARHFGYRRERIQAKDKIERNVTLLRRSLEENPSDAYEWFQLGRTYLVANRMEPALEAFGQALDHVQSEDPFLALLVELFAHTLRALNRSAEALPLIEQVSPAFQERSDMCYVEGLLALDTGDLERAERLFQRCLQLPDPKGRGGASQAMTRTFGPAYHLGVMREVLELPEEAAQCYRRALELFPEHAASREALARVESALR